LRDEEWQLSKWHHQRIRDMSMLGGTIRALAIGGMPVVVQDVLKQNLMAGI
jgi:hypothetical protein